MMSDVPMRRKSDRSLIRDAAAMQAEQSVPDVQAPEEPAPAKKVAAVEYKNWNVRLPADLVERVYGACADLADTEDIRSNVGFTVRAMEEFLDRMEDKHNGGRRYHQSESPFKSGRPVSYRR